MAGPALYAAHSQSWKCLFLFRMICLTLPRNSCTCKAHRATCLVAALCAALSSAFDPSLPRGSCTCKARRATCLVAALCAALSSAFDPSLGFGLPSAAPSWREHCAEFERWRHAEPRGLLRHAERRVRTPGDSCGFLGFVRLVGAEEFIAANHNPAEHRLCFACQNELPKQATESCIRI